MEYILPNALQFQQLADKPLQMQEKEHDLTMLQDPLVGAVTVQSVSAVELKVGASPLSARTQLRVYNPDPVLPVRIGGSDITQKKGYLLEPLETIVIHFDEANSVSIYGRSTGYEVALEVVES